MKKALAIVTIIFLLALAGIGYYVFINSKNQNSASDTIFNNAKNFFPFGKTAPDQTANTEKQDTRGDQQNRIAIERFFQISSAPVAGYVAIDAISTSSKLSFASTTGTTSKKASATSTKQINTSVRFVERATSHIYEAKIPTLEKNRLSNITTPKAYEAIFSSKGDEVIIRYLNGESISSVYSKLTMSTSSPLATLSSSLLPSNTDIVIAKGNSLFYTLKNTDGSIAYNSTFDRKKPVQVFQTELRDILGAWGGGDSVALFSKPHSEYPGVAFLIDTKTGKSKQVLSDINGLTAIPNASSTYILFNSDPKDLSLSVKKLSSNTTFSLGQKTLPEKCVWSKLKKEVLYCAVPSIVSEAGYPEKWYQGEISFIDKIWMLNVETGEEKMIYDPLDDGKPAQDAINLTLNDKENYLFFINKRDLTLWGLSLE